MGMTYGSEPPVEAPEGDLVISASGMSKEIYETMNSLLAPPLQEAIDEAEETAKPGAVEALKQARHGWQKLAYCIAKGVVDHIKDNMEVREVDLDVEGDTAGATGGGVHTHGAGSMTVTINNLTFE